MSLTDLTGEELVQQYKIAIDENSADEHALHAELVSRLEHHKPAHVAAHGPVAAKHEKHEPKKGVHR